MIFKKIIAYGFALSCTFASQAVAQDLVKQPEVTIEQLLKQLPADAIKAVQLLRLQLKQANPTMNDTQINQILMPFIQKMPLEKKGFATRTKLFFIIVLGVALYFVVKKVQESNACALITLANIKKNLGDHGKKFLDIVSNPKNSLIPKTYNSQEEYLGWYVDPQKPTHLGLDSKDGNSFFPFIDLQYLKEYTQDKLSKNKLK